METRPTCRIIIDETEFPNKESLEKYKSVTAKKFIQNELMPTHTIPEVVYHYTRKENLDKILEHGLVAGYDGGVFVSTDLERLRHFLDKSIVGTDYLQTLLGRTFKNEDSLDNYIILKGVPLDTFKGKWYKYTKAGKEDVLFYHGNFKLEEVEILEPK